MKRLTTMSKYPYVFPQGYPGTLIATVTYIMTREGMLKVIFEATTDKQTPVNIVQHSYFNLAGHASGSALDHMLYINGCAAIHLLKHCLKTLSVSDRHHFCCSCGLFALRRDHHIRLLTLKQCCATNRDHYTPLDETAVPTGEIVPVGGTPFDFTEEHSIRESIGQVPGGYDHNYVLFGMGRQAKFIVKNGAASNMCDPRHMPTACCCLATFMMQKIPCPGRVIAAKAG